MKTHYVYVLIGLQDFQFYVGHTTNLEKRVNDHNSGKVNSTKFRRPLQLVYFEGSFNLHDALHREKYLKTTYGKRYLRNRLKNLMVDIKQC